MESSHPQLGIYFENEQIKYTPNQLILNEQQYTKQFMYENQHLLNQSSLKRNRYFDNFSEENDQLRKENEQLRKDNEQFIKANEMIRKDNKYHISLLYDKDKIINKHQSDISYLYKNIIDTIKKSNGSCDGYCCLYPCKFDIIAKSGCNSPNCVCIHKGTYRYYIMLMLIHRDVLNKNNRTSKFYGKETSFEKFINNSKIKICKNKNIPTNNAAINIEKMQEIGCNVYNKCFDDYKLYKYDSVIKYLKDTYNI